MLARLEIVADETVTPAAPAPFLDKAAIDRREINRKAVKHWATIRDHLFDWHGRSMIRYLGPGHIPQDPSKPRIPVPTLKEFRGPYAYDGAGNVGSWMDVGNGQRGDDLIALVEFLGSCDRRLATDFLKGLTDRLAVVGDAT
jgi:hypothetical protein